LSNTITPVGAPYNAWYPYNPGANTFPVNPTTVGDLLVVVTNIGDTNGAHATALSGGGVASWHQLGPSMRSTYSTVALWMGVVTTAGAATVSATIAGTSFVNMYVAQQFTGGTVWSVDHAGSRSNASSLVLAWPTLVASSVDELYVGCAVSGDGHVPGSQTAGYVIPSTYATFLYNPGVSGSQSPSCGIPAKALSWTVGALISAA
jgi:hypothetical protein